MNNNNEQCSVKQFEFPIRISVSRPQFKPFEIVHYLAGDAVVLEDNVDIEIGTFSAYETEVLVVARVRKGLVVGISLSPCSDGWLVLRRNEPELNRIIEYALSTLADDRQSEPYPIELSEFIRKLVIGPVEIHVESECIVISQFGWCCYYCYENDAVICFGPPLTKPSSSVEV